MLRPFFFLHQARAGGLAQGEIVPAITRPRIRGRKDSRQTRGLCIKRSGSLVLGGTAYRSAVVKGSGSPMTDFSKLSRRERQIMQVVFSRQQASVQEIRMSLPDPPTPMAVRRMLAILCEKGHLRRQKRGREFLYLPRQSKDRVGRAAFRQVLGTFFNDSLGGPRHAFRESGLQAFGRGSQTAFPTH